MMNSLRACLAFTLILFGNVSAYAQKAWTLKECVDYALENNITVKQNALNSGLNELTVTQNKYALLPSLNSSASRNWNFGRTIDPFTNLYTNQQVSSDNISLNSNLTLFSGFQLLNTLKQSKLDYMAGVSDLQKIKNDISLNVISAYLQVLYAKEQLKVAAARVAQSQEQRDRVKRMVDAGTMVQGNLLDAESQLSNEELSNVTAVNQLTIAKLTLTQLLQLQSPEGFDVQSPDVILPDVSVAALSPAQIYELALKSLPEVKAAETRLLSAEKGVTIAKGAYYPRLTAFGSISSFYSSSSENRIAGFTDNGLQPNGNVTTSGELVLAPSNTPVFEKYSYVDQLDNNVNKGVGLSINIPLFNGLTTRTNVNRAKLNYENAKFSADLTRNQVFQSIQQAHADATAAKMKYDATEKNLKAFEEAFQYAEKRFNAGLLNSLEYLTSTNNLTRTKIELLQAKYDFIFRVKVLDFYAGNPLIF